MDVADLEPNVFFCQRPRRVCNDVFEALEYCLATLMAVEKIESYLQTLVVFLLLFVNYPEAEVYLIRLFEVGLHTHHLGEGFLCVLKGSVTIIKYSDTVP